MKAPLTECVRTTIERRQSAAAGKHGDRRTKRSRDRSARERRAITEAKEE